MTSRAPPSGDRWQWASVGPFRGPDICQGRGSDDTPFRGRDSSPLQQPVPHMSPPPPTLIVGMHLVLFLVPMDCASVIASTLTVDDDWLGESVTEPLIAREA